MRVDLGEKEGRKEERNEGTKGEGMVGIVRGGGPTRSWQRRPLVVMEQESGEPPETFACFRGRFHPLNKEEQIVVPTTATTVDIIISPTHHG